MSQDEETPNLKLNKSWDFVTYDCLIRKFVYLTKYYYGDQVKEYEMGGQVKHVGTKEMHTVFQRENMKGKDSYENLGLDGMIILKMMFDK